MALTLGSGTSAEAAGGSPTTGEAYGFAARVDVGDGAAARGCSAALVAPQWIVTISSCFEIGDQPVVAGPPPKRTTVLVGSPNLGSTAAKQITVNYVMPHPERRVVLARLAARATGVAPVAIASTAPTEGESLRLAGFGRTATEWVPELLHSNTVTVSRVATDVIDVLAQQAGTPTTCKGDAGGPAVRESGGVLSLVAIHQSSGQDGCLGETDAVQGAREVRVDGLGEWIRDSAPSDCNAASPPSTARQRSSSAAVLPDDRQACMPAGRVLESDAGLRSLDGRFELWLQGDGNLVLYRAGGAVHWQSGTRGAVRLANQDDGKLVLFGSDGAALWSTGTYDSGPSTLWLQDDGNLVLYRNSDAKPTWASGPGRLRLARRD